jgi:hypothetical protein
MMDEYTIVTVSTAVADAWIVWSQDERLDYAYGGTRKVPPGASDRETERELVRLMRYESHLKNRLINRALDEGALDDVADDLPPGFATSRVGGGRCLFRARDEHMDAILSNPADPAFEPTIEILFAEVGARLNELGGRVKLTPDFGKFSGVSDILYRFTPHVLGIRREDGGCGGKASYTTTGILAALDHAGIGALKEGPVTVIGSDGALGVDIAKDLAGRGFRDLKVADLAYSRKTITLPAPEGSVMAEVLPSQPGRFTNECLRRGGVIVPATHGGELAASDLGAIPRGTILALAHNLALPPGRQGRALATQMEGLGIDPIPGQILTLGGALTSRLEWFSRAAGVTTFDKPLAHRVVHATVNHLMGGIPASSDAPTLYDQMCDYAAFDPDYEDVGAAYGA